MKFRKILDPSYSTARPARMQPLPECPPKHLRCPGERRSVRVRLRSACTLLTLICVATIGANTIGASNARAVAVEVTVREVGSTTFNQAELITKNVGDVVSIEVVVDTGAQIFWGYSFGMTLSPGSVSSISTTTSSLPPLLPLGVPTSDSVAGTISGLSQAGFFGGLPPDIYIIETVEFVVDSIPPGGILIEALFELSSDSFLIDGESCPGTLAGCTVNFYPMKIVGGPSVPMLSPFGIILLIGFVFFASLWSLAPARRSSRSVATRSTSILTLLALVSFSLASAPLASAAADKTPTSIPDKTILDASSPKLVEDWGIEIVALRLAAVGRFLDFRYRVVNAEKAQVLFGPKIKPYLVDSETGHTLQVPVPPKLGPMKSTRGQAKEGRNFFIFFANPGRTSVPGHKVTVDFGPLRIKDIELQ